MTMGELKQYAHHSKNKDQNYRWREIKDDFFYETSIKKNEWILSWQKEQVQISHLEL